MLERIITSSGYHPQPGYGVFSKDPQASITYSDGEDLEAQLLLELKRTSDLTTLSFELMEKCTDWFHSYHLSPARANLLRPFRERLGGSVLELGAGCGAITRYLGENASSVVAVEGTWQRSLICSERTRDQPNVHVIQSDLSDFELPEQFDTVVVVGVLEYAALFSDSPHPYLEFLEKAKRHLKPNGILLLAIENKVGLKYFAGSPEDHVGTSMFGIEDKYEEHGVRTFSKKAIAELFRSSGFKGVRFHYPLPDYKFTRAVISQDGVDSTDFDSAWLAAQLVNSDPQIPVNTYFDLRSAWKTVEEAGLEDHLANSFLIEASISLTSRLNEDCVVFGHWYSDIRRPEFMHEKKFWKSPNGLQVKIKAIGPTSSDSDHDDYAWVLSKSREHREAYFTGSSYARHFTKLFRNEHLTRETLLEEILRFVDRAKNFAIDNGYLWSATSKESSLIDGRLIDALPRNAVMINEDKVAFFDFEFYSKRPIELGFYLFRLMGDIYFFYSQFKLPKALRLLESKESLVKEIWRAMNFGPERLEEWESRERAFEVYVRGGIVIPSQRTHMTSPDKEAALQAVRDSLSWKLTKPVRWLGITVNALGSRIKFQNLNRRPNLKGW